MRISRNSSSSFFLRVPKSTDKPSCPTSASTQKDTISLSKEASLKQTARIETGKATDDRAKSILVRMRELAIRATDDTMSIDSEERCDLQIEIVKLFGELEIIRSSKDQKTIEAETAARIDAINRFRDRCRYPLGEDPASLELEKIIKEDFMANEAHFTIIAELKSRYDESLAILREKYTLQQSDRASDGLMEIEIGEECTPFRDAKNYDLYHIADEGDRAHIEFVNSMQNLARIDEWEDLGGGRYYSPVAVGWTASMARVEAAKDDMQALEFMPMSLLTDFDASQTVARIEKLIDDVSNGSFNFSMAYRDWAEQAAEKMETRSLYHLAFDPNTRYDVPTVFNSYMSGYAQNGNVGFLRWSFIDLLHIADKSQPT